MATMFKLVPKPTFKADVTIPVPGEEPGKLTFIFKHYPTKELAELEKIEGRTTAEFLGDIVQGWALAEEFNKENLEILLNNYPHAHESIVRAYYTELYGNREKN